MSMEEEYDICVSCGKQTGYKKTDTLVSRYGYIEGAGQLCLECAQRDNEEVKHAQKLWRQRMDFE